MAASNQWLYSYDKRCNRKNETGSSGHELVGAPRVAQLNGNHALPGVTCGGGIVVTNSCSTSEYDSGRGTWTFSADGKWHTIEEYVNSAGNGTVTIWYDGQ